MVAQKRKRLTNSERVKAFMWLQHNKKDLHRAKMGYEDVSEQCQTDTGVDVGWWSMKQMMEELGIKLGRKGTGSPMAAVANKVSMLEERIERLEEVVTGNGQ